jgi:hypothetical protein
MDDPSTHSNIPVTTDHYENSPTPSENIALNSLKAQFWTMHASLQKEETSTFRKYDNLDTDRPLNTELIGHLNKHPTNSSSSYGGSLPLSAMDQNIHVLVRSSNCWKTTGRVLPASNPSFKKINQILKGSQID